MCWVASKILWNSRRFALEARGERERGLTLGEAIYIAVSIHPNRKFHQICVSRTYLGGDQGRETSAHDVTHLVWTGVNIKNSM